MKLKMLCIATTLSTFVLCSMIAGNTKETKASNITERIPISGMDINESQIIYIGKDSVPVSEEEYNLLLRVCMSECGGKYGEPLEGKIAVVETILNRCEIYDKSIEEVIYEPHQYSVADNGLPDETVEQAVDIALRESNYPDDMIYFRTGNYHSFGKPYQQIGNHYFSLKESD